MYSSFVQYRPLEVQKITQPLLYFHCFFNIKFIIFFSKTYFTKSVRNFKIALLYIMKHVKILLYKVTTLNFMYDIYIYIGGGTHTVVCTAHLYSTKHTVVLIWSSWGVKNHATSFIFSLFFQHKINNFFFKHILQKVSEMLRLHSYILWSMLKFFRIKSQH
jgi:hypothetical protein